MLLQINNKTKLINKTKKNTKTGEWISKCDHEDFECIDAIGTDFINAIGPLLSQPKVTTCLKLLHDAPMINPIIKEGIAEIVLDNNNDDSKK